ncbi:hypothetical protein IMZ48_20775 [Candidatus Bathyarchaeota archaeon]|nr:hypothetical protein [Candidatus Bathyarchaeota archaeon]
MPTEPVKVPSPDTTGAPDTDGAPSPDTTEAPELTVTGSWIPNPLAPLLALLSAIPAGLLALLSAIPAGLLAGGKVVVTLLTCGKL